MELICQILTLSNQPIIDLQELLVGDAVVGGAGVTQRHVVLNVDTDDKLLDSNNDDNTQYKYNLIMNLLHWRVTSSE